MRAIIAFLLGIAVTVGAAYVHDSALAKPTDKPLVNWDQLGGVTQGAIDSARNQWNKLTK
jgi:hypothetical protein